MTEYQIQLLEHLAHFKFMNSFHMLEMGVAGGNQPYLYSGVIKDLRDIKKPYIKRQVMPILRGFGRLPDVYYLTKKSVEWLQDERILEQHEIRYPIANPTITTRDYVHRMATIDIHIGLKKWLDSVDGEILNVSAYFDKPGAQRNGEPLILNKITISEEHNKYLLPDLITRFSVNEDDKIIVWEQHNGKDTKKLLRQIETHIIALKGQLVAKKYGVDKLHRVGIVFEHGSILNAACKRLFERYGDEDSLHKFFIFKTNEQVKDDFYNHWMLWSGELTTLTG